MEYSRPTVKSVTELKADLLADLQERFRELKGEGKDDETALQMTIDSIGDIESTVLEVANLSRSLERQVLAEIQRKRPGEKRLRGRGLQETTLAREGLGWPGLSWRQVRHGSF